MRLWEQLCRFGTGAASGQLPKNLEGERSREKYVVAWVNLNYRPRPYPGNLVKFYSTLQVREDCQNTCKALEDMAICWSVVGGEKSTKQSHSHLVDAQADREAILG
jgi:hypothetical protein